MTEIVSLSLPTPSTTVDFTKLNVGVQYVKSNPLFIIQLPQDNQGVINLTLSSIRITVTFDLLDGIAINTNMDKLSFLSNWINTKTNFITFTWGSIKYCVVIESLTFGTLPGRFNYMPGCSVVLIPVYKL